LRAYGRASHGKPQCNGRGVRRRRLYRRRDRQEIRHRRFYGVAGRRDGAKLEPLVKEIEAAGGSIVARALDARKEDEDTAFLNEADKHASLEVTIFNVGANVNFPILETTDGVFRKVWEMACWAGFVSGRESARLMLPRGQGNIFFTGATASLRGGSGFAAFASAKFGLRAVAQAMARELGPKNIHVAHLIIDSGVDTAWVRERREQLWGKEALDNPDLLMPPASVAASYLLAALPAAAQRLDLRTRDSSVWREMVIRRMASSEWKSLFPICHSPLAIRPSSKTNNKRN
jgi:NAD(P)-dependent dehydrogenase (short-subunit alcohol dehydrogenase family)